MRFSAPEGRASCVSGEPSLPPVAAPPWQPSPNPPLDRRVVVSVLNRRPRFRRADKVAATDTGHTSEFAR